MQQQWILEEFFRIAGINALWPDSSNAFQEIGFKLTDISRLTSNLASLNALSDCWAEIAAQVEHEALTAARHGHAITAMEAFHRASVCYGFAQWARRDEGDITKKHYLDACLRCYERIIINSKASIHRVSIPFENHSIAGILHISRKTDPSPTVIVMLGMDMVKEYFPIPHWNVFKKRGLNALTIDGPGQGETNVCGLKLSSTNFELSGRAVINYLELRPEVQSERIGIFAIGTGVYFALRLAAIDQRVKAVVGFEGGVLYDKVAFAQKAQPNFKLNLMHMMGIHKENEYGPSVKTMTMEGLEGHIKVPVLLVQGEFDELMEVSDAYKFSRACQGPVRLIIYKNEGHVLGGVFPEALADSVDWLADRLNKLDVRTLKNEVIIR